MSIDLPVLDPVDVVEAVVVVVVAVDWDLSVPHASQAR